MAPTEKFETRANKTNSLLCVGLDPEIVKLPERFHALPHPQFEFNKHIIGLTHAHAAAYKLNTAFYESRGAAGLEELKLTTEYVREQHPDIFLIGDAKRGDIGNTMKEYANELFDYFGFDAATVSPYLGRESLEAFLERDDKATIVLCRTSNPGAGDFQDLFIDEEPLWRVVARRVSQEWNEKDNCMMVVGATYPEEMEQVRAIAGDMTLLVPGIGAQGGSVEEIVGAGLNSSGMGMIVNSARGIIFADDPAAAAKELKEEINKYRK